MRLAESTVRHGTHPSTSGEKHMAQFQTGDVVRLKSGGPCMTITALGASSGWTPSPAHTATCMWLEGQKQQETVFDVALLEKASSRGATHLPVFSSP
jgi:uncharacterized protein YodC (DUF2158 family)